MLTNVVILFDEFDRILWKREGRDGGEGVLQFLTPGMLPKLKNLNESAKNQRVVFILSTNLIGGLDKAAAREGRFDEKIGIYPPDVLSRWGRLTSVLASMEKAAGKGLAISPSKRKTMQGRIDNLVRGSMGGSMNRLGKPGWFTAPTKAPTEGSPFYFLSFGGEEVVWPDPEKPLPLSPDADYNKASDTSAIVASKGAIQQPTSDLAVREWKEWKLIDSLDQCAKKNGNTKLYSRMVRVRKAKLSDQFAKQTWEEWRETCDELFPK